jgi:hypothetical protein
MMNPPPAPMIVPYVPTRNPMGMYHAAFTRGHRNGADAVGQRAPGRPTRPARRPGSSSDPAIDTPGANRYPFPS